MGSACSQSANPTFSLPVVATTRKPEWLKVRAPGGERYRATRATVERHGLHTVCEEARCPNIGECWGAGTATIMLLGDVCTRGCRFCHVTTGNPRGALNHDEPANAARAVAKMGLDYVVLTSVDRDDLEDGGAAHFADTVRAIRAAVPRVLVETLTPDFRGHERALATLFEARPSVFAHNIETVRRLTRTVRDRRASYDLSLAVLEAGRRAGLTTKSSIMVGLGERDDEILETLTDLRAVGVSLVTIGQYLQPTSWHLPVVEFVTPARFDALRDESLRLGFRFVASGPLVRSSYRAAELFIEGTIDGER
ncbi:MAG: lipoyl synthase [Deltaproteobacteria bacterium]|nr:lipoyl synthase [Deltaproteobacteria bacterium]